MLEKIKKEIFNVDDGVDSLHHVLSNIDEQISRIRKITIHPGASLKIHRMIEDLKWEREKIIKRIKLL